jgi:hypothetical protein
MPQGRASASFWLSSPTIGNRFGIKRFLISEMWQRFSCFLGAPGFPVRSPCCRQDESHLGSTPYAKSGSCAPGRCVLGLWRVDVRRGVLSADRQGEIMAVGYLLERLPRALDFPDLLRISGLRVCMLGPALFHAAQLRNIPKVVKYCLSLPLADGSRSCDPSNTDRPPARRRRTFDRCVADLSDDLVHL